MILLERPVVRETAAHVFSQGKDRPIIAALEPPCTLAVHLKGSRKVYRLHLATCFWLAVKGDENGSASKGKEMP